MTPAERQRREDAWAELLQRLEREQPRARRVSRSRGSPNPKLPVTEYASSRIRGASIAPERTTRDRARECAGRQTMCQDNSATSTCTASPSQLTNRPVSFEHMVEDFMCRPDVEYEDTPEAKGVAR